MPRSLIETTVRRIFATRGTILENHPFYGRLLMHLSFSLSPCKTAYTNMRQIFFDPDFIGRLNDTELCFVILHEIMHCVLKHCVRCKGKIPLLYNIACDIVVNSLILEAMEREELVLDGNPVMHLTPAGKEGRLFTAEQIYEMLEKEINEKLQKLIQKAIGGDAAAEKALYKLLGGPGGLIDLHEHWPDIRQDSLFDERWNRWVRQSLAGYGSGIPVGSLREIEQLYRPAPISWKAVLYDFISKDCGDFSFSPPDRRFSDSCFIFPTYLENIGGESLKNILFAVDTSASIDTRQLSEAYAEIRDILMQFDYVQANVVFFDCEVSELKPFDSVQTLYNIRPVGGGGTDFSVVFNAIQALPEHKKPIVIIFITDGLCPFPPAEIAAGIPVIWLITETDITPPWGICYHIN